MWTKKNEAPVAVPPLPKDAAAEKLSARERLLAAATELFYEEGINTVGIDRVIARAGVAKASLYSAFGSKEELIRAYLEAQFEARKQRLLAHIARYDAPRDKLLSVFDLLGEISEKSAFRGCAFIRASAEAKRGGSITAEADKSRAWTKSMFADLARQAGAKEPERLARQLALLYDGAIVSAQMDRDASAAKAAKLIAASLLDAAI